jgi:hypothetical protein
MLFFGNKFSVSLMDGSFGGIIDVLLFVIVISILGLVNVLSLVPYGVVGVSSIGMILCGLFL